MKLQNGSADIFVPDGQGFPEAISRTTHLGIGAHQDDLEFMAFHGILECFHSQEKWFGGVICTDGAGSSASGAYAGISPADLCRTRILEQRNAASIGRYSFVAQLGHPSKAIHRSGGAPLVSDLQELLVQMQPEVIYTHNPADKHETHLKVLVAVLDALKTLPPRHHPKRLLGCEMWRGLDWLMPEDKTVLNVSGSAHLAAALNGLFDSQIAGGKRYDLAVTGRRYANATLLDSHSGDALTEAAFAMDLTPLLSSDTEDVVGLTLEMVDRFKEDIRTKLQRSLER